MSLLSGRASSSSFGVLAWHEHLNGCGECRALLEAEEALETLLATLPEPHLPPALALRLLARLEPVRSEVDLDRLLDRSLAAPIPLDLARNVLAGLAGARRDEREERALDGLLERLPTPQTPPDIATRVLCNLEQVRDRARHEVATPTEARHAGSRLRLVGAKDAGSPVTAQTEPEPSAVRTRMRTVLRGRRWLVAASVLLAAGAAAWIWSALGPSASPDEFALSEPRAVGPLTPANGGRAAFGESDRAPSDELLASLDLLESWELVADDSVEVDLAALDAFDELLLAMQTEQESRR